VQLHTNLDAIAPPFGNIIALQAGQLFVFLDQQQKNTSTKWVRLIQFPSLRDHESVLCA